MKKSIFSAGLMFFGVVLLVVSLLTSGPKAYSGSRQQDEGGSPTPVAPPASSPSPVVAPSSSPTSSALSADLSGVTLVDSGGLIIAEIPEGGIQAAIDANSNTATISVKPSTVPLPSGTSLSTMVTTQAELNASLNKNGVYFPVYVSPGDSSAVATLTVPASMPVAFCSGNALYNKATGKCSDGKFPYKIVPLNSLTDPAAQNPTTTCKAPTVPTWNPAMKKWNCIVPAGFKNTLGE